ncbi:universal stress protein [Nocardioides sp. IC4_145]|uniref:universal stress protein n=1 Tax=Nocardioides sp. IC4_145 TaxID=2714037 RepID=UPI00140E3F22|nr:universal stress protein [Nocardioides sp. IC4_145]NHC21629.1 universal stress protein [Nocardioides sp. IC4_145]
MDELLGSGALDGAVVAGVDGSTQADEALRWAAEQAVLEGRRLVVLNAADAGTAFASAWAGVPGSAPESLLRELEEHARGFVVRAGRSVADLVPGVEVLTAVGRQDPRQALLACSQHAALLVVGSRGRGPVRSLLLGSVGAGVARHATCPVVVVRPWCGLPARTARTGVTLAADPALLGPRTVGRALLHARVRGLPITVLHRRGDDPTDVLPAGTDGGVVVRHRCTDHDLVRSLEELSGTSHLVLVGAPRTGRGSRAAMAVLEHAHGPVCVVPED